MPVVASIFRDPVRLTFVDEDNRELASIERPEFVPRVGENVRLAGRPHLVERVGYDFPDGPLERIWVVCRPT
ncbi:hypothetical protein [Jatrophihabitans endophyticus]|uniref:hypothetical protein n=1 Tax=Jatrophihabitans endophyticus TaxID=1206085 RepID=UPI001A09C804|nr:hypothetical protein [Jatrophihabitans endophyticus]MBE7190185.1 hypothetical protein [Jatrophihabitans endophyticus]